MEYGKSIGQQPEAAVQEVIRVELDSLPVIPGETVLMYGGHEAPQEPATGRTRLPRADHGLSHLDRYKMKIEATGRQVDLSGLTSRASIGNNPSQRLGRGL